MEAAVKPKEMEQKRDIGIFSSGVQGNCIGQGVFTDRKEKGMGNQMIRIVLAVCIFLGGICPVGQVQAAAGSKKEADSITYIQFSDMQEYEKREQELYHVLMDSEGEDRVIVYVKKENRKKMLPASRNIQVNAELLQKLYEIFGEKNVKAVEKRIENTVKMH